MEKVGREGWANQAMVEIKFTAESYGDGKTWLVMGSHWKCQKYQRIRFWMWETGALKGKAQRKSITVLSQPKMLTDHFPPQKRCLTLEFPLLLSFYCYKIPASSVSCITVLHNLTGLHRAREKQVNAYLILSWLPQTQMAIVAWKYLCIKRLGKI